MKKYCKKLCLALTSLLLSILFAEVGTRVVDPPPHPLAPININELQASENPVLVYDYRFPSSGLGEGWQAEFQTNPDGLRDRKHEIVKPRATQRIICIGDSTTAGNGVKNIDDRFTAHLEEWMNRETSGTINHEVFNMGVTGYQTVQEVETLRTKGLKYQPDIVILTVCLNDFRMGGSFFRIKELDSRNNIQTSRSLSHWLIRTSRLAFFIHHRLFAQPDDLESEYRRIQLEGECPVERGMRQLAELQQKEGFEVCVVVLPIFRDSLDDYSPRNQEPHDQVAKIVSLYPQFHFADLKSQFQKLPEPPPYYACDRLHLNEVGHIEMTKMLLPIVQNALEPTVTPRVPETVSSKDEVDDSISRN